MTYFLLRAGRNQEVIDVARAALSDGTTIGDSRDEYFPVIRINRAIAQKRLGHCEEMIADLDFLE